MPHAIEWSLATPKMSAVLPSSSPIEPSAPPPARPAYHRAHDARRLRDALRGVRGFILDADGVLVLKGAPIPGAMEALRALQAKDVPFRVVTNFSQSHRERLAARFMAAGLPVGPDRIITGGSAAAAYTAQRHAGRPLFVLAAPDALSEFDGQRSCRPTRPTPHRRGRSPPSSSATPGTTCPFATSTSPSG